MEGKNYFFIFQFPFFFLLLKLVDLQVCEARQRPHILKQGEGFGQLCWPLLASQPFRKKSRQVLRLAVNRPNCLLSDPKASCFVLGFFLFLLLCSHTSFLPGVDGKLSFRGVCLCGCVCGGRGARRRSPICLLPSFHCTTPDVGSGRVGEEVIFSLRCHLSGVFVEVASTR